jgi:nitrate/nitrite-specific signal transduction histidine kinase
MSLKSLQHSIAIVGINQETAALFPLLLETRGVNIVRILNHEREQLGQLKAYPDLDVIIDTTNDKNIGDKLRALELENVDIVGALSARIFFLTGKRHLVVDDGSPAERDTILSSLYEIRQAILLSQKKEEVLKLILNVAIRSVAADTGSIMLLDSDKRYLTIEFANGISPEIVTSTAQKVGKGIAGKVVRSGKPVLLNGSLDGDSEGEERRKIVSSICCPMIIAKEAVGTISVNSTTPGKEFTESDLNYTMQLAEFTADIVRASQEYEQSAQAAFALSLIDHARTILNLSYYFEERLNLLLLRIVNSLQGEICNYYTFNKDMQCFILKASSSFKFDLLRGKRMKFNEQLSQQVLEEQETIAVDRVDKASGKRKWYIAHPVKIDGSIVGILFLHMIDARRELEKEIDTIAKIGDLLAVELGKALKLEASQSKSEKLSAISEASYNLASTGSLEELATVVVSVACLVLEAQSCVFRIYRPESETLDILESFSLGNSLQYKQIRDFDKNVAKEAFDADTIFSLSGPKDIVKYGSIELCKSALSMCLKAGRKRLGTLSIYNKTAADMFGATDFTESDKDVFRSVCLQTAKAMNKFLKE